MAKKIKALEKRFRCLRKRLLSELKANEDISAEDIINSLGMLPESLRKEYTSLIEKLPTFPTEISKDKLFLHLSPYITFIDYGLLLHLIVNELDEVFSEDLKSDMLSYDESVQVFLEDTTIQQIIDLDEDDWPGEQNVPQNFSKLKAKIGGDPKNCSLKKLNKVRRKLCCKANLSETICVFIGAEESMSFFALWIIPSSLIFCFEGISDSFYKSESICSITIDEQLLYPSALPQSTQVYVCKSMCNLIGASLSEPHTSGKTGRNFCVYLYIYISIVRTSSCIFAIHVF